jgi:hypothetical protein
MLRARTRLHRDEAARQLGDEQRKFPAIEFMSCDRSSCAVAANQVKPGLTDINADCLNFHDESSDVA